MRKNNVFALVLVLCFFVFSKAQAADIKIAVVDLQKALQTVDEGKKAKSTLEKEFNEKKKQLQAEEEAIKKLSEDFKKQSMVLSEEAKNKKQGEIQEKMIRFREMFGKSQYDIQQRERTLTEPIINKLKSVVEAMGSEKGYTLILEKNENNVLFLQQKDDLTDEVIKSFNKKNG